MSDNHLVPATVEQRELATTEQVTHPLAQAAMEVLKNNPTPEAMEKVLAMQERYEERQAKKAYTRAMNELKAVMPRVLHQNKVVEFGSTRYKHTDLASAVEQILPHLTAHGFSHSWIPSTTQDGKVSVVCRITHCEGHSEEAPPLIAPPDTEGKKSGPKAVASTITMLERYSLLAALGVATADMGENHRPQGPLSARDRVAVLKLFKAAGHDKDAVEEAAGKPVGSLTREDVEALKVELLEPIDMEEAHFALTEAASLETLDEVAKGFAAYTMTDEQRAALVSAYEARKEALTDG